MDKPSFFAGRGAITLSELARLTGSTLRDPSHETIQVENVAPLARAGAGEVTFLAARKNRDQLENSSASAVFVTDALAKYVPDPVAALLTKNPSGAFAEAAAHFFPESLRPQAMEAGSISEQACVHPSARLEDNVTVDAGAIVGANVEIGANSTICAGAVVAQNVRIGRNSTIGTQVSLQHALIGDGVIIHPGARIGQDGFGFTPGPAGLQKVPQLGRVIIQDRVEIGANTTIDRGALDDTVIGEGTKIDNLVQIAHNVRIGRHSVIVAQVGIAGSTTIGNQVMIGGAAGINGHITIGDGAQIAALSGVAQDVPAGARWGGVPARPMRAFLRDMAVIKARTNALMERDQGKKND